MLDDICGTAFPFRVDPQTGGIAWATGTDKVRQNIRVILGTRLGERPMLRDFGTNIPALVHDPNDDVLADITQTQARQALLQWEPRVLVTGTRVEQHEGEFTMRLAYVFVNAQLSDQLLLPIG